MSELVEFIRGCLDADEQTAREAMTVVGDDMTTYSIAEWWEKPEHARVYAGHWHPVVQAGQTHGDPVFYNGAALPHVARHDPARVLVEVEAKRAIVALHSGPEFGYPDKHLCVDSLIRDDLCETLRLLASVYRDHPDYQEGWAL